MRIRDGSGWEREAGYSRAVRRAQRIIVSGTTDTGPDGSAGHPDDTYGQARGALERVLGAVYELGGQLADVVMTRMLLAPGADWQAAARAHVELLGEVAPANTTLYVGELIGEGLLVEVELEAEVLDPR